MADASRRQEDLFESPPTQQPSNRSPPGDAVALQGASGRSAHRSAAETRDMDEEDITLPAVSHGQEGRHLARFRSQYDLPHPDQSHLCWRLRLWALGQSGYDRGRPQDEGYITWAEFESNQRLITDNANGKNFMIRGTVREAPLAGLLRCGHRGRKLHLLIAARNPGRRYHCSGSQIN